MSGPSSKQQGENDVENWLLAKIRRPPPTASPEVDAFMKEAQGFLAMHHRLQTALSGRFRLVRFVLSVYARDRSQWPEALAGLREDHAGLARAMLERLTVAPEHIRSLLIANDRFDDAARAAAEVRAARARLAIAPPDRQGAIIAEVSFPKLHGRLYLLSTFDATFKDDPVLGQLFPPIERTERVRGTRTLGAPGTSPLGPMPPIPPKPQAPARPAMPKPAAPSAAEAIAKAASKMQEGIDRLLSMRGGL